MKGKLVCVGASMLMLVVVGCKSGDVPEVVPTESRSVSGNFTKIRNEGSAGVYVRSGSPISVQVHADQDDIPHVTTSVDKDTLIVKTDDNYKPKKKIRVSVVMPHLVDIDIEGSGNVNFENLDRDPINIVINGSGNVSGDGTATTMTADINGSGNLGFFSLTVSDVKLKIAGAGNADFWPGNSLDVSITGSGNVRYRGNPKVTSKITGAGHVSKYES